MAVAAPLLTLGDQVADWIETMLVFASADHRGDPFVLDDDEVRVLQSAYEVRPHGRRCWPRVDPGGVGVGELEGGAALELRRGRRDVPVDERRGAQVVHDAAHEPLQAPARPAMAAGGASSWRGS